MPQANSRIRWLDLAKGLGILSVMWGHIMLGGWTHDMIYAFHMPAFFFLSGMVFRRERYKNFGAYALHRGRKLLLPYLFWSVVTWGWWVLDLRLRAQKPPKAGIWAPLLQTLLAQGSAKYLIHNVALWFVPCLVLVCLIYWWISRLPDWAVLLCCLGFWVLGRLMMLPNPITDFTKLPWNMDVAFCALPYYALGNLLTRRLPPDRLARTLQEDRLSWWTVWVACFFLLLLGTFYNGTASLAQSEFGESYLTFQIVALFGTASLLIFSALADGWSKNGLPKAADRCLNALAWFGSRSLDIMMIHIPIMLFAARLVTRNSGMNFYKARELYRYTVPGFLLMLIITLAFLFLIQALRRLRDRLLQKLRRPKEPAPPEASEG